MSNNQNLFEKIKSTFAENKMAVIAIASALTLSGYAVYQTSNYTTHNSLIDVEGVCLKKISKDRYKTEIIVKFNDTKSSAVALTKSKKLYAELIAFVDTLKDADKTVETETTRMEVSEEKLWSSKNEKYTYNGFNATLALEISTENPETLDKVISFVSGKKDMLIGGIENYVSAQKMKHETEDCLAEAIKNAKSKAKSITNATGDRIGKLVSVYVNSHDNITPMPRMMRATGVMAKMSTENLMDSSMVKSADYDLNVKVNAKFQIK